MDLGRQRLRVVQGADRYLDLGIFYSAFYAPITFENTRLPECIAALEEQQNRINRNWAEANSLDITTYQASFYEV